MASICIEIEAGYLKQSTKTLSECTDYVLTDYNEYARLLSLTDIFQLPDIDVLQQMFDLGFQMPLVAYLTAWGYHAIIHFIQQKDR